MSIRSLTQFPEGSTPKIKPGRLYSLESTHAAIARHGAGPLQSDQVLLQQYSQGSIRVDTVVHYPGFQSERLSVTHQDFDSGELRQLTLSIPCAPPEPGPGRNDLTEMLEQIHSTTRELEGTPKATACFQSNTPYGQTLVLETQDSQLAWQLVDQVREVVQQTPKPPIYGNPLSAIPGAVVGYTPPIPTLSLNRSHFLIQSGSDEPKLHLQGSFDRNSGTVNFSDTDWLISSGPKMLE